VAAKAATSRAMPAKVGERGKVCFISISRNARDYLADYEDTEPQTVAKSADRFCLITNNAFTATKMDH
jgi:hypothetical protein